MPTIGVAAEPALHFSQTIALTGAAALSSAVDLARAFAIAAHEAVGQVRKYTGEPYWHHPAAVARLVATVTDEAAGIAAAWLHDVVEDTRVTEPVVRQVFGDAVAALVSELTDVSRPEDGNRAARKAIDRAHSGRASPLGQTIKVADLIDNTRSIVAHDPGFARVYMREKRLLLEVLTAADAVLLARARGMLAAYEEGRLDEALRADSEEMPSAELA